MSSDEMRHKLTDHMPITDHGEMDRWMLVSRDSSVSVQLTAGTARKTSMARAAIRVIRMISGTGTWLGMNHSTEICSCGGGWRQSEKKKTPTPMTWMTQIHTTRLDATTKLTSC